jgi:hypothetical protein
MIVGGIGWGHLTINKGGRRQRKVVGGGRGREDNDSDLPDGPHKMAGVGLCNVQQQTFSGGIRYSAAAANQDKHNDRGGMALLTRPLPPRCGRQQR